MNRKPHVFASLSRILIVLVTVCAPLMARATTTATPAFSLTAGTYTGTQTVAISDSTTGSTIYYTTNGSTPTTSSTKYTGSITVSATESLKAIATASGDTNSAVATAAYTIVTPTPTFSPVAGSYGSSETVTISDSNSAATLYYTTNGTTPTTSSTKYTSAITVSSTETLEALATATGDTNSSVATAAYTLVTPAPTFSLVGGSYFGSQTVTISDSNSAATFYYTTNGTTPTTSSTKYTSAITVSSTETLETIAAITGYSNSAVATVTYTITTTPGTLSVYLSPSGQQSTTVAGVATETFDALSTGIQSTAYVSAAGIGTYTGSSTQPFAIVAPNEFGGATDSTSSTPTNYFAVGTESGSTSPVNLALTQPVSYFGFWWSAGDAYNRIALYSGSSLYGTFSTADLLGFLNNGTGTINAINGTAYETSAYFGNPNITSGSNDSDEPFAYVSFAITGATITQIVFYNTSTSTGFESDNHSVIFNGNTVTIPTTFVPVESLTLGSQSATPVFVAQGIPLTVAISSSTPGVSINYTTNGTAPTSTSGTLYAGPIGVSQTETIKAIAFETGMTSSPVASATYTIPSLTVASSSNPSTYGGSVTLTATISSGPTGTVTFYDGGISIGTGTISGTTAIYTTTLLAAGTHTITASWPGNASFGSVLSSAITQTVDPATPTITFSVLNRTYGVSPFAVAASSNSSGAFTYSVVSGPATISGATVTITGIGTVVLQASQPASGNYAAGTQNATFTVAAEAPTITFTVSNQTFGVAPFTVSASSNSSGALTYSVASGPATISGSTVTITGVGSVVLQASQTASGNYAAGTQNATIAVAAGAPTITFTVSNEIYGVAPFAVSATSNSSGAMTYAVISGPATISGSAVTITGAGTVVLQASEAASGNYAAGTQNATFTVSAEAPTITFTVSNQTFGVSPFTVSASSNSSGAITYSVVSGPATTSGSTVTITGAGTVVLLASQVASGNYLAGTKTASLNVSAEAPTITFAVSNQTFGVAPYTISASSTSSGAFTYSVVSGPATISGSTVTITGVGTVVLQASQAASGNFTTGTQNASFTVAAEPQAITFAAPASPVTFGVAPSALSASSSSGLAVTFSVVSGPGTISGNTLTITAPGTAVIAADQAGNADYAAASEVTQTIVINPSVSISITPTSATLSAGQTQQFTDTVSNTSNTAVSWTIVSAGTGTVSTSGLYTAPSTISSLQSVTVTATSQADTTQSASATISLTSAQCILSRYSYSRAIVIDHTRIPNTDQINFPFLFDTTDPTLANLANGGHVTNTSGYDIIFTSDPAGQNLLNFEMEQYDPVHGQVAAWVQIPTLSHTTNTVIYLFYGNASIVAPQQNPAAAWDSNFNAVYHLQNTALGVNVADSTANANSGIAGNNGIALPSTATGVFGTGAGSFNGSQGIYLPPLSISTFTLSAWVLPTVSGNTGAFFAGPIRAMEARTAGNNRLDLLDEASDDMGTSSSPLNINAWNHVVISYDGTIARFYIDGVPSGTITDSDTFGTGNYFIGESGNHENFIGNIDELRLSNSLRSADWIATEYNNQSSTSTFYSLYSEDAGAVTPPAAALYASQSQQFTVIGLCSPSAAWSMPPGAPGTLTASGLYTAPASIASQQTLTISATGQVDGSTIGTATVTLVPPVSVSVTPPSVLLYGGQTQQFTADVANSTDTAVTWNISPAGAGSITSNGFYMAPKVSFPSNTFSASSLALNGSAVVTSGGSLQLTDGSTYEAGTAWYPSAVPIQSFATDFSFQLTPSTYFADADGITFTIQGLGTGELGLLGGCLGYCGILDSVAIKFDTYNNVGEGINSTGLFTDGAEPDVPAIDLTPTGINLHSNDVIDAHLVYDGTNLTMTLTDTVTNGSAIEVFPVDIPGTVGGNTAYVGFTGATGVGTSTQDILSWTFASLAEQAVTVTATSVEDTTKAGHAEITLTPSVGVSATPARVVLYGGQAQQFTANVTNTSNTAVTWAITPATGAGTISTSGLYTAPASVTTEQIVTITAASVAAPTAFATMTVTLVPQVSLSLAPSSATLNSGQSQQFTVSGTGTGVTWTVIPAASTIVPTSTNVGTISSTGLYTAPTNITTEFSVIVTATSAVNPTVFALATVNLMPPTSGGTGGGTIDIGISGLSAVILPNSLALTGTVTDSAGLTPTISWSQVSGPGAVTFTTPQQAATSASFSEAGYYVLELSASDTSGNSGSVQWPVVVNLDGANQGWIGSPLNGSTVSGLVPITVAAGTTLQSGFLTYYPSNNPNSVVTLNNNTTGSGQIGTFDATTLANGTYWIELQATTTSGETENNLVLISVAGNYKPGRVTATVTDLVVPSTGLAINIQRTYDSLNAATSGDFGYGWNLGINVNLTVGSDSSVTFTLGGQRRTFYLTPQYIGFLPYYDLAFTPEPGFFGSLTDSAPGCADGFDFLVPEGSLWFCVDGGEYNPPGYVYTDPNGTSYTISSAGNLQSIVDRTGNGLTITANGITSTTGLNVPFARDSLHRITQITDPQGNQYLYTYDTNGNLASVNYPNTTQPSTYTYGANHLYLSGTDFRNDPLPTSTYYTAADTDPNGLPLNGRLASVQDALGETTSYAYNLATDTTTVTYPADANGNVGTATMVYDSYGMLLSSTDPLGLTTANAYDVNHNLISVTDPLGNVSTYTYDSNGNKTSSTYPATPSSTNTTSTTQFNQYSEPTSTIDELGNVRVFNYDANFNPQSVTDSIGTLASFTFNSNQTLAAGAIGFDITVNPGNASQFTYDSNGNMISRTDALGRTTSYVFNSLGQKLSMTTPTPAAPTGGSASTTSYTYDQLGNRRQTAAPLGRTTNSTYDGNSNKISDTDARGNATSYPYDALNRLVETDYPDGTKATKTYDFRNNVIRETDQNSNVTLHAYDLSGRQVSVTRGYGTSNASSTAYAFDNAGRKVSETDALGHSTTYTYDADSRLLRQAGVQGNFTYTYDNAGNRIAQTDANNHTTKYQFDARKRLTVTTYPDGTTTTNAYDGPGNLASVTDQASNVIQYTYDAANQLKTVVQTASPNTSNNTNSYGYDPLGNLIALSDENFHTTQNSFDLFNEPVSKTLPAAQTETRNYDNNGNLTSLVHFNGVTTSYTYDQLNRLLSRSTPGDSAVSFTYTPTGKYLTSTAGDGTVNYSYDSLDRLITKATPEGSLSYTYFPTGKVETITSSNSNGASVAYTYDDLNRLSTVVDNRLSGNNTTTYTYDPASNLATATYPNGVQSAMTYDALNRITGLAASSSAAEVSGYSYQRGPTGDLTSASELNGRSLNWTYDGIYRLTNEAITSDPSQVNGSVAYGPDPVGNRLLDTSSLAGINSGSFGYNADDEVSTETYDANGNTLSTGGKSFTYDAENHLTGMSVSGTTVSILYDAFGNRVAKTVNGVTNKYLVEDGVNPTGYPQVLDELAGSSVTRTYTYGLQRISEDQLISNAWTPIFYSYDGGGNVRQLTNSAGAVTDTYEYDAFGNDINHVGSTPNNYFYRGEQYDPDLALYYLRARYYNPPAGRFLSRDPNVGYIDEPATLHKYLYAGGDPVNRVDPSGRADTIETIFTVTVVSSPLEIAAEEVGLALTKAFCYIAKTVARATLGVPPGMSHVPGPPGWPGLSAAACRALGF
jgi:RHS repeat-associated protein